jgi:hypothetical protein
MSTITALAAVTLVVFSMMSGCRFDLIHPMQFDSTPKVTKAELERDISQRLISAGQAPLSVSCPSDLAGTLGQSTRCDVTMGQANSFEPVVTVTGLEGKKVNYDISPSVSKSQLEAAVSQMLSGTGRPAPDAVICQSGLDGRVGAVSYCDVTVHGVTSRRTVQVADVTGLALRYGLIAALDQTTIANSLVDQLRKAGQQPDSATCAGDLEGKIGNTVTCTAVTGAHSQAYLVTVTAVDGANITYRYTPAS